MKGIKLSSLTKCMFAILLSLGPAISRAQYILELNGAIDSASGAWGPEGSPIGYWYKITLEYDADEAAASFPNETTALYQPDDWTLTVEFQDNYVSQVYTGFMSVFVRNNRDNGGGGFIDGLEVRWNHDGLTDLPTGNSPIGNPRFEIYDADALLLSSLSIPTSLNAEHADYPSILSMQWDGAHTLSGQITSFSVSAIPEPSSAGAICGLIALVAVTGRRKRKAISSG
ncbi:MAG: hypothetical protein SynsKO_00920 [Synoicihabitans sp.]